MNIRILCASDRLNYGDLLFPLVLEKVLTKENPQINIKNYGIIRSDLTYFGALPTENFGQLIKDVRNSSGKDKIIIAGGEVLGGNWFNIYRFLFPLVGLIYSSRLVRILERKTRFTKTLFNFLHKSKFPFILNDKFFSKHEIYYNSVGANAIQHILNDNPDLVDHFNSVEKLSIRDVRSAKNFFDYGVKTQLVPDCALVMSEVFEEELQKKSNRTPDHITKEKYLVLQFGKHKGPKDIKSYCKELAEFGVKNKLKIVLCPIGLALGHEDAVILKKIASCNPEFIYFDPKNVFQIMNLIKNAELYMGSSLHGVITAQSFNVPYFAYTAKINKLEHYINTWSTIPEMRFESKGFTSFDKVEDMLSRYNPKEESARVHSQKAAVYANIKSITNKSSTEKRVEKYRVMEK